MVPEYGLPIEARSTAAAQDEPKSSYGKHASAVDEPLTAVVPAGHKVIVLGVLQ